MKFPKMFGNRKARRAAEKRGAPALEDLPADLREAIVMATNAKRCADMMACARFDTDTGVKGIEVHGCIEWLKLLFAKSDQTVRTHPEFATFFPKEALALEQQAAAAEASKPAVLVAPNGEKLA